MPPIFGEPSAAETQQHNRSLAEHLRKLETGSKEERIAALQKILGFGHILTFRESTVDANIRQAVLDRCMDLLKNSKDPKEQELATQIISQYIRGSSDTITEVRGGPVKAQYAKQLIDYSLEIIGKHPNVQFDSLSFSAFELVGDVLCNTASSLDPKLLLKIVSRLKPFLEEKEGLANNLAQTALGWIISVYGHKDNTELERKLVDTLFPSLSEKVRRNLRLHQPTDCQNIMRLIERYGEKSVKILQDEYNLSFFGRYSFETLEHLYNDRGKRLEKPLAVVITAKTDWNGSFYSYLESIAELNQKFDVRIVEAETDIEFSAMLKRMKNKYGRIDLLIVGGHGNPLSISLGSPPKLPQALIRKAERETEEARKRSFSPEIIQRSTLEPVAIGPTAKTEREIKKYTGPSYLDFTEDNTISELRGIINDGCEVVLVSCSTGKILEKYQNMAQLFSNGLGVKVFAPTEDGGLKHLSFGPDLKITEAEYTTTGIESRVIPANVFTPTKRQ